MASLQSDAVACRLQRGKSGCCAAVVLVLVITVFLLCICWLAVINFSTPTEVRTAGPNQHTWTVGQTVEVDAPMLRWPLCTEAILGSPAGTVVATDLCCPLCDSPVVDAEF